MRRYEQYKDSQYAWLSDVPAHWKVTRLKNHLRFCEQKNPGDTIVLSLYRELGIVPKDSRDDNHNVTSEDTSNYRYVRVGDFVINKMKAWQGSVAISNYEGIVSPAYYVYRFTDEVFDKRFFHYLMRNKGYAEEFRRLSGGIRIGQWDLPKTALESIAVLVPPMPEQESIATYLDEQCALIDGAIADAKASIEEYKAWKASIIFEAVTKGIESHPQMKESNAEWMGLIPASWQVKRFSFVNYIRARLGWKGLKAEEYVDEGYPFLSAFNIVDNDLDWSSLNHITQDRYDESPEIKLSVGDIVLVKDGAGIGKCARIDILPLGDATVNSSLAVITPSEILDYRYEYYFLLSPLFMNIINRLRNGMGVPHLTQEAMKEISIPVPPVDEQKKIADCLDKTIGQLNEVIRTKETLIDNLVSYKRSIVYEVVTGKRKVVQ